MVDLVTLMNNIANAIRLKTNTEEKINAQDFPQKIQDIEIGKTNKSIDLESSVITITPKNIYSNILLNNNNVSISSSIEVLEE